MPSPYLPHLLFALTLTSISINIVSAKKSAEEDRTRLAARESLLSQIHAHLASPQPVPWDEVERLKRLARKGRWEGVQGTQEERERDGRVMPDGGVKLSWTDVFYGRKVLPRDEDAELSEWDKKDLEKLKSAFREEEEKNKSRSP